MADHRKRPRDPNQLAKSIVDIATGQTDDPKPKTPLTRKQAAELGGHKRAISLTPAEKTEIASKAARARWKAKT